MCSATQAVKCGVASFIELSVPLVQFYFTSQFSLACRSVTVHPTLSRSHYFTYVFTVFSRHFRRPLVLRLRVLVDATLSFLWRINDLSTSRSCLCSLFRCSSNFSSALGLLFHFHAPVFLKSTLLSGQAIRFVLTCLLALSTKPINQPGPEALLSQHLDF